ncbi:MAG: ROK family protein [Bdellovibrionota bacterium]
MNKKTPVALAFDLGGTKLSAGLISNRGKILYQKKYVVNSKKLKSIIELALSELVNEAADNSYKITGCGMASAGPMDLEKGILLNPANFPGIKRFEMVKVLKTHLKKLKVNVPVYFQNDAVAAALAEGWLGIARKTSTYICVTLGTGLGSGTIFRGQPLQNRGAGSEWGHAMYGDQSFEQIVSGPAIIKRINEHYGSDLTTLRDLSSELVSNRDFHRVAFLPVVNALAGFCRTLSMGIYPEVIAFSGGVMLVKKYFWAELNREYKKLMKDFPSFESPLKECSFKNDAGLIGAASLVWKPQQKKS